MNPTKNALPPRTYDRWEFGEQLRQIERTLRPSSTDADLNALYKRDFPRVEPPHAMPNWHVTTPSTPKSRPRPAKKGGRLLRCAAWTSLSLGTAGFVCGAALLVWSFSTGQTKLWTVGLPAAIVGQVAILLGLLLQVDRLWREHHSASSKLKTVSKQLQDLEKNAKGQAVGVGAGESFGPHLGLLGPQSMIDDLRGQIDLLANKIARENRWK